MSTICYSSRESKAVAQPALTNLILPHGRQHTALPAEIHSVKGAYGVIGGRWGELLDALKNVRAFCRDEISDSELATLSGLILTAEKVVALGNGNCNLAG